MLVIKSNSKKANKHGLVSKTSQGAYGSINLVDTSIGRTDVRSCNICITVLLTQSDIQLKKEIKNKQNT